MMDVLLNPKFSVSYFVDHCFLFFCLAIVLSVFLRLAVFSFLYIKQQMHFRLLFLEKKQNRRFLMTETRDTLLIKMTQYHIFKISNVHSVILTIYCAGFWWLILEERVRISCLTMAIFLAAVCTCPPTHFLEQDLVTENVSKSTPLIGWVICLQTNGQIGW